MRKLMETIERINEIGAGGLAGLEMRADEIKAAQGVVGDIINLLNQTDDNEEVVGALQQFAKFPGAPENFIDLLRDAMRVYVRAFKDDPYVKRLSIIRNMLQHGVVPMEEGIIGRAATDIGRKLVNKVPYAEGIEHMVRISVESVIMRLEIGLQSRNSNDPEFLQKLMGDARKELIELQKWMRKHKSDPLGLKD